MREVVGVADPEVDMGDRGCRCTAGWDCNWIASARPDERDGGCRSGMVTPVIDVGGNAHPVHKLGQHSAARDYR
jgi:hypothetical protein